MTEYLEVFSVDEFDDVNQDIGWQVEYRQLTASPFQARFWTLDSPIGLLTKEQVTGPLEVCAANQEGGVALVIPTSIKGEISFNGYAMSQGDVFTTFPGCEFITHTKVDTGAHTLRLSKEQFQNFARAYDPNWSGIELGQSSLVHMKPEIVGAVRKEIILLLFVGRGSRSRPMVDLQDLMLSVVGSLLAQSGKQSTGKQRAPLARRRYLLKALDYIESNLGQQISMADVCRSADLGIRTLERLFIKELGMPPSFYIKARRLNAVRRSLLDADPQHEQVSKIAYDHGFNHLGRFSDDYRQFFGELPSSTLKNPI